MNDLLFHAARGDHRYTFDASLTYLALGGGVASLLIGLAVVSRRAAERQRWAAAGVALGLLVASLAASLSGAQEPETFADAFPTAFACDLGGVVLAGIGSVAVAFRARSVVAPALLVPAWLLAQCGVVHARALHDVLPRIGDLETRPVHVGCTRRVYPSVTADVRSTVDELLLSPLAPGQQEVLGRGAGHRFTVERTLRFNAVEERGDALLPLELGNVWLLRSADGGIEATITVGPSKVERGLRLHEVTAQLKVGPERNRLTIGGPEWLYEADGTLRELDGRLFVSHAETSAGGGDDLPCRVSTTFTCTCARAVAPPARLLPGPVRCTGTYSDLGEMGLSVLATLLSLGTADTTKLSHAYALELVSSGPRAGASP